MGEKKKHTLPFTRFNIYFQEYFDVCVCVCGKNLV